MSAFPRLGLAEDLVLFPINRVTKSLAIRGTSLELIVLGAWFYLNWKGEGRKAGLASMKSSYGFSLLQQFKESVLVYATTPADCPGALGPYPAIKIRSRGRLILGLVGSHG